MIFLEEGTYHTVISHLQLSENEGDEQVLTGKDQDQVKLREERWSMNSRGQKKGERQSHCQYEDKPSWVHSTLWGSDIGWGTLTENQISDIVFSILLYKEKHLHFSKCFLMSGKKKKKKMLFCPSLLFMGIFPFFLLPSLIIFCCDHKTTTTTKRK